jgi:hypothetical protein
MIKAYLDWKAALGEDTGMSESLIHVHVGLAIFVFTALLLKRQMRSWIPLCVVVVLALLNELLDYGYGIIWDIESSTMDFFNTILWPTVLFLLARRSRRSTDQPTLQES